jgi:vesicle coat complex subunit
MAYLLSALLVRPHQKLSILMHNTIIKDISSDNPFDNLTALTMLRYFINNDIAREMLPSLRKMLSNCNVMVRKKCLLVLHNVHQLYPHLLDDLN